MLKVTAVWVGLCVLVGACAYLRYAPIQSAHANTLNLLCELGIGLFGVPAFFLSSLLYVGWCVAFVAWVWKSEAFPIRIVRDRKATSDVTPVPNNTGVYTYAAPGMPMCPKCGQRPAIFYCSTHQGAICLECVAKHDRSGECVYVPAFRAPKPNVEEVIISGPAKPRGSKPTSVLGID
jgi:hypothetical protein